MSTFESRFAEHVYTGSEGRQRVVGLRCPYCGCITEARLWSVAGSGKRCECGAVFHRNNQTGDYVSERKTQ